MTAQNQTSINAVHLTHKAREKTYRLLSEHELRHRVHTLDGELYQRTEDKGQHPIYYLLVDEKFEENLVIKFRVDRGRAVVITQMHDHDRLRKNSEYEEVDTIEGDA